MLLILVILVALLLVAVIAFQVGRREGLRDAGEALPVDDPQEYHACNEPDCPVGIPHTVGVTITIHREPEAPYQWVVRITGASGTVAGWFDSEAEALTAAGAYTCGVAELADALVVQSGKVHAWRTGKMSFEAATGIGS